MRAFSTLRPRCEACGLDYAFIDAGDGPAIFIIMIAGAIVVGRALIVEVKYQPPFWLHAALWLPLILATTLLPLRSMKSLLIALQFHHKAARRPADRPRAEMTRTRIATARRRRLRHVHAGDGGAVRRPRRLAIAAPRREARADRGADRAAGGRAGAAAAAVAMERADAGERRIPPRQFHGDLCSRVRTRWSTAPARRCAPMFPVPAPGRSCRRGCRAARPSWSMPASCRTRCRIAPSRIARWRGSSPASRSTLTGYIRFPEAAGMLTPAENIAKRLWFTRDHLAMAQALGWGRASVAPFYIDLESPVPRERHSEARSARGASQGRPHAIRHHLVRARRSRW